MAYSAIMNTQELFARFSQGLHWNAWLYLVYRATSTIIIILLYNRCDPIIFSGYANLNSMIFLLLLWLDAGFQKAIPRFCPEYAKNTEALKAFIKSMVLFKITIVVVALPLYIAVSYTLFNRLSLSMPNWFFYIGTLLVITEGIISVIRLIYHAHFLQRIFNSINALTLLIEMSANIAAIILISHNLTLLAALLINKIIANSLLLILSWYNMDHLYGQQVVQQASLPKEIHKQFIMHTTIMWFNNNLKSLTERNFLLPIFTFIFGPEMANMFKVANDGALLFYRVVLKTIGTTDTALFSHILTMEQKNETWQVAFKKLSTKIAAFVLPLLACIYVIYNMDIYMRYSPYVFQLFLIITTSLLLEILFSPYERLLEVHQSYYLLMYAYVPYIIMLIILLGTSIMTSIGLLYSLVLIHGVRLVSVLSIALVTRIHYNVSYPVRFVLLLSILLSIVCIIGRYGIGLIGPYVVHLFSLLPTLPI